MRSVVSSVKAQRSVGEIKNSIEKALDLIDFRTKNTVRSVVIKPNLCYYWHADTGYTTDPRVVAGVIDYIRERWGADTDIEIVEADATAMRTKYAFLILGYEKLAREKKVGLFNLSTDSREVKKARVNGREIKFEVPRLLLNCDLFINVPKLKIMRQTTITCALKNIFGCIATPRKIVYHQFLDEAIVGINKILQPDVTIVDGLVALSRFPVRLDLVMAGSSAFSVDSIASRIMGFNPRKVSFLKLAVKEGLGDLRKIEVVGADICALRRKFPHVNQFLFTHMWDWQLRLLKMYNTIVNDIIPPILETS